MNLVSLAKINLKEQTADKDIEQVVYDFFSNKKGIKDIDVHAFADSLKVEHSDVENVVYKLLNDFLAYGRWNDEGNPEVDAEELNMALKVETEHSGNDLIKRRIALDHLAECKNYYSRLAEMEMDCE